MRAVTRPRARRRSAGQALVELALAAPILAVLLAGSSQVGLLMYAQVSTDTAAREGSRAASQNPNTSGAFTALGLPTTYRCGSVSGDWTSNPVCRAVRNSTSSVLGLIDPTRLTAVITGSTSFGGSGTKVVQPGLPTCPAGVDNDGFITVAVAYPAPLFVPVVDRFFSSGGWSSTATYSVNDVVTYKGSTYTSLMSPNVNHQPDTSPTFWRGSLTTTVTTRIEPCSINQGK